MQHKYFLGKSARQAFLIRFLSLSTVGLTIAVLMLGFLCARFYGHQTTIIIPPTLKGPVKVSSVSVDANYLQEMAIFFTQLRLTTTPETVRSKHRLLMQYIDPSFYTPISTQLKKEGVSVQKYQFHSVFFVKQIVPDPSRLQVKISGLLSHWIRGGQRTDQSVSYQLTFSYHHHQLLINSFSTIEEGRT